MAEQEYEDYKFPDEPKAEQPEAEEEFEIIVEDDTPPEDRGQTPMPKKIVEELEQDELEEFTGKAKEKLSQLKKVWNDERRAKEAASKEAEEASRIAQQLLSENQKLKTKLSAGEQNLINKYKENISYEIEKAKSAYKEAYDSGDSDRLVEAQEKLTTVQMEAKQIERYQPEYSEDALQNSETQVQIPQQPQRLEPKTQSWLDKNSWYGVDDDMSFLAMGIHRRLEREGVAVGSEHYFGVIDKEMRQRFPEKFETE
jgi:myosin heavy subunit